MTIKGCGCLKRDMRNAVNISSLEETIRQQQSTIDRLTEQLNLAAEENAKLVSDKCPYVHIRIDCSEYEKDLAIREKLIELGWTPPAEIEAGK